ncbi:hypothetical protein HDU67_005132, partial [Dinochytrium kinnereticum]
MTMIDAVTVRRRLSVENDDIQSHILHAHSGLNEMQRVLLSSTRFWNVGSDLHSIIPELLESIMESGRVESFTGRPVNPAEEFTKNVKNR